MAWIIIFFYVGSVWADSSHALTFENVKKEYKKGKFKTLRMPSGKIFYMKKIFELPEKQQKKAWDKFVNGAWEDAGSVMKKEGKILKEGIDRLSGKKKHSSKYSDYIRSDKEIEQYIKDSYKRSIQKYKRECNKGVSFYCLQLAVNYYRGAGLKKNYKKAKFYFAKACRENSGTGCLYLGEMYYKGLGVEKSRKKATKLYDKACNLKEHYGCMVLGSMYEKGIYFKQDITKAMKYFKKICNKKVRIGCWKVKELQEDGYL